MCDDCSTLTLLGEADIYFVVRLSNSDKKELVRKTTKRIGDTASFFVKLDEFSNEGTLTITIEVFDHDIGVVCKAFVLGTKNSRGTDRNPFRFLFSSKTTRRGFQC